MNNRNSQPMQNACGVYQVNFKQYLAVNFTWSPYMVFLFVGHRIKNKLGKFTWLFVNLLTYCIRHSIPLILS